jgi:hypothetical protein
MLKGLGLSKLKFLASIDILFCSPGEFTFFSLAYLIICEILADSILDTFSWVGSSEDTASIIAGNVYNFLLIWGLLFFIF